MLDGEFLAGFECRLFEKAISDLRHAAAADARNASDREQILDKSTRTVPVNALKRCEYAGMIGALPITGTSEDCIQRFVLRVAAQNAALPLRRQVERGDEIADQSIVAETYIEIALAERGDGIECHAQISASAASRSGCPKFSSPACRNSFRPSGR